MSRSFSVVFLLLNILRVMASPLSSLPDSVSDHHSGLLLERLKPRISRTVDVAVYARRNAPNLNDAIEENVLIRDEEITIVLGSTHGIDLTNIRESGKWNILPVTVASKWEPYVFYVLLGTIKFSSTSVKNEVLDEKNGKLFESQSTGILGSRDKLDAINALMARIANLGHDISLTQRGGWIAFVPSMDPDNGGDRSTWENLYLAKTNPQSYKTTMARYRTPRWNVDKLL
ncbi:hypothetical protein F5890DRAFT_990009 [Lentinula detonsa]|uniref:Uncharacterized protein n=1 Tax=Lentinula detonsa TaxID=2804962 RepID=A0AA38Q2P0_9AGAR|nr:hypothetical protein F5890DRAFT_990009 [Lentinula detonsa]